MSKQGTHIRLKTPRLGLRQFTEDDVDNLFSLNSDPEVMRYLKLAGHLLASRLRDEIIEFFLDAYQRFDRLGTWAAESADTGEFLGWFHFRAARKATLPTSTWAIGCAGQPGITGYATEGSGPPDQHGPHRPGRPARVRAHDDGQYGVQARAGEMRPDSRPHLAYNGP